MKPVIRIEGRSFGRLTVVSQAESVRMQTYWNCVCECGNKAVVRGGSLKNGNTKSCGCLGRELISKIGKNQTGDKHPQWKGGKWIDSGGYVRLRAEGNYPSGTRVRIGEHTLVMEEHLGRKLFKGETIHHKNGIRSDNRIENLELKASNHGAGQSIPDLIDWGVEILKRYKPELLCK